MKTVLTLKTILALALVFGLGSVPAFADDAGEQDVDKHLVKDGLLGTVNVLRELDIKTWTNRVTVTSNVAGGGNQSKPEDTIDGSAKCFRPNVDPSKPLVLTYTLPGLRTVSSLAIAYEYEGNDAPAEVQLKGSSDGGATWFKVFKSKARKSEFLKCFKPVKVNVLRLTQEGDGTDTCGRRTKEVCVYADAESPLPLFGDKDSGAFNFLRGFWYADKLKLVWSPENNIWTQMTSGVMGRGRFPEILLFKSSFPTQHDGGFGDAVMKGKRLYLRFDLDKACPMNYCLLGTTGGDRCNLGLHPAEFYTANGTLDPGTLPGSSIQDLTGQGWILQKAWDKDPDIRKEFQFAHPGKFNQMLVVWDAFQTYENDRWNHLEIFGSETPGAGSTPKTPQK